MMLERVSCHLTVLQIVCASKANQKQQSQFKWLENAHHKMNELNEKRRRQQNVNVYVLDM